MAEMLAPSLSRMTDATVLCAKAYALTVRQAYDVLRPGNAGELPAATTIDTTAAAQTANLGVANAALIQIGATTIRNLTSDQTREAQLVRGEGIRVVGLSIIEPNHAGPQEELLYVDELFVHCTTDPRRLQFPR